MLRLTARSFTMLATLTLTTATLAGSPETAPGAMITSAGTAAATAAPSGKATQLQAADKAFRARLERLESLRIDAALANNESAMRRIDALFSQLVSDYRSDVARINGQTRGATQPKSNNRDSVETPKPAEGQLTLSRNITRRQATPVAAPASDAGTFSSHNAEHPTFRRPTPAPMAPPGSNMGACAMPDKNDKDVATCGYRRQVTKTYAAPGLMMSVDSDAVPTAAPARKSSAGHRRHTPAPRPAPGLNFDRELSNLERELSRR